MLVLLATIVLAGAAETAPPEVSYRSPTLYPRLARDLPLPPVECVASLDLDASGTPRDVVVSGCPDPFALQARRDLGAWRFRPAHRGGEPVSGQLEVTLDYRLHDDPLPPPDATRWQWTDHALSRRQHLDRTMGWASVGGMVVGMSLVGFASAAKVPRDYRQRYLTAGFGLALGTVSAIAAQQYFEGARTHRRQRALWAAFRPPDRP